VSLRIVDTGTWIYGGTAKMPVDVVALDYDFWYEIGKADDQLEPGEQPQPLGPDGVLYYVRFKHALSTKEPTWVDSGSHATVDEARRYAAAMAPSEITWSGVSGA
jgi:hypothetical protein